MPKKIEEKKVDMDEAFDEDVDNEEEIDVEEENFYVLFCYFFFIFLSSDEKRLKIAIFFIFLI